MKLSFDKFERYEVPQVTLCNPNSRAIEVDGEITITDTVGVLSNPKGMNLKLNFNAPHELSFDYYLHKSTDPIKQSFYDSIYEAIQTDRYIYLTDIGYFIISSVTDSDEDNIDRKSITCKSCEENELATAEGLHLKEGTYYLHTDNNDGLLDLFLSKTVGWTIGYIDPSLLDNPRYVEKTEVDNGYNFLYTTIQDMFECIVEPDIIRRTVSVYSREYYAEHHLTDIHIAKYNLLKHKTIDENDEDKYTALNVQGKDENLEIRAVNPTGKNVIYNFKPRYPWMSPSLRDAVIRWQEKCESVIKDCTQYIPSSLEFQGGYADLQKKYYAELEKLFNEEKDIDVLKGELEKLKETKDIAFTMADGDEKDQSLSNVNKAITAKQKEINSATSAYNAHKKTVNTTYEVPISQINSDCALDTTAVDINGNKIFTVELLNELMTHIKPTDYVDEYMLITESMPYSERFEKAKELMDRAQSQLVKISSGQKTYSIDTRSFLFNKQFKHFSEQLCAGAIIYVETKNDIMEQLHLTGIDINYDEKSTNFTLGNKYDRSDLKALYDEALGQNSKSFSELKYIAGILEEQRKQLDYQRNWVADLRTLTLDNVLTSEDQAFEINNRGLIGRKRKLDENGEWDFDENGNPFFEPEQVKLIHNNLIFTKDNWEHAEAAVGKIAVGYNSDGSVKYDYGFNGRVVIGELFLGNNLVLTGTGAGIKIKDSSGNDAFYADDNGDLVLSGTIFANSGQIGGVNLTDSTISAGSVAHKEKLFYGTCYYKDDGTVSIEAQETDNWRTVVYKLPNAKTIAVTGGYDDPNTDNTKSTKYCVIQADSISFGTYARQSWGRGSTFTYTVPDDGKSYWLTISYHKDYTAQNSYIVTWPGAGFRLTSTGNLYVTNGNFAGKVTATSGEIGGWTINNQLIITSESGKGEIYLASAGTGDSYGNWIVAKDSSGNTTFKISKTGKMTATAGDIGGWDIGSDIIYKTKYDSEAKKSYSAAIRTASMAFAVYNRSGQHTGVPSISDNWNYSFYVSYAGKLYANNAEITGTINAGSNIYIGKDNGCIYAGSQGQIRYISATGETVGQLIIKNQNVSINLLATNNLCSINGDATLFCDSIGNRHCWIDNNEGTFYVNTLSPYSSGTIVGTWTVTGTLKGNSSGTIVSDINKKNTVQLIDERYSLAFDNFRPVTYKYNNGTSDRLHTGFIAQDVKTALDTANISTKDFAGLVIFDQGENTEEWTLRYEEFVALNTWQIQHCKKKITELENTIAELKTQIQTLTAG